MHGYIGLTLHTVGGHGGLALASGGRLDMFCFCLKHDDAEGKKPRTSNYWIVAVVAA